MQFIAENALLNYSLANCLFIPLASAQDTAEYYYYRYHYCFFFFIPTAKRRKMFYLLEQVKIQKKILKALDDKKCTPL